MPWIIATTLMVSVPLLIVYFYVGKKILNALVRVGGWQRNLIRNYLVGTLSCVNIFPLVALVLYLIGGRGPVSAFAGEKLVLDLLFVYPFWFALVIVVQVFLVYLLADTLKLVLLPVYRKNKERWRNHESRFVLGTLAAVAVYSIAIIVSNTWSLRIREATVTLPPAAVELDGLRIVHIGDVQGDGRTNQEIIGHFVKTVNSLKPDIVLFAGDLVTSGERYISSTASLMGEIEAAHGKIAAVGDHDVFSNKKRVMEELASSGFRIAEDTTLTVRVKEKRIAVTLATYTYRQRPGSEKLERAAREATGADLKIFLVHQPAESLVAFALKHGYHCFAAGHTHGGGIAFGIPGLFLLAPARFESPYMSGFYQSEDMLVSVTNGLGMTLAPIRYHAPAEITLLRFVR